MFFGSEYLQHVVEALLVPEPALELHVPLLGGCGGNRGPPRADKLEETLTVTLGKKLPEHDDLRFVQLRGLERDERCVFHKTLLGFGGWLGP